MKAKRKMYENGGKTTKKYKDATGTYVIGVNGQKIYDGVPAKKPATAAAMPASKPAAKAAAAAPKQAEPANKFDPAASYGSMIKKGDYSGAAKEFASELAEIPKATYETLKYRLKKSMR